MKKIRRVKKIVRSDEDAPDSIKIKRALFTYYGGKWSIGKYILPLLPSAHKKYVEVFGGAASMLFLKNPSKVEIYNDVWGDLVNFVEVLKDKELCLDLFRYLLFDFDSRGLYDNAKLFMKNDEGDAVTRAGAFYILMQRSFDASFSTGWRRGKNRVLSNFSHLVYLPLFHLRLQNVTIENKDFEDIFDFFDSQDTLFYVDPPYVAAVHQPKWSFKEKDQIRLLKKLTQLEGMVVLSGYDSELYKTYVGDWKKYQFDKSVPSKVEVGMKMSRATEVVWMNERAEKGSKRRIF